MQIRLYSCNISQVTLGAHLRPPRLFSAEVVHFFMMLKAEVITSAPYLYFVTHLHLFEVILPRLYLQI